MNKSRSLQLVWLRNRDSAGRLGRLLAVAAWFAMTAMLLCAVACGGCARRTPFFDHEADRYQWNPAQHRAEARDRAMPVPESLSPRPEEAAIDPFQGFESPVTLSIEDAVLLALANNKGLRVAQLQPMIAGTFEQIERARFDPVLEFDLLFSRNRVRQVSGATQDIFDTVGERQSGRVGIFQPLPTGTDVGVSLEGLRTDSDRVSQLHQARLGLTLTQALLQGRSWDANIASIEQARLDTVASHFQLRGFVQTLVADVERAYWEYLFVKREIEIFESSLALAQQQLNQTQQRVDLGAVAATELAVARAEVAQRREELIRARGNLRQTHLVLMRLLNPQSPEGWELELDAQGDVEIAPQMLDTVQEHVMLAFEMRPELNEARLLLERDRLEVIRTRDGLLPRLDFFLTLGKTGYADAFGEAWRDLDGDGYDMAAALAFTYPLGNRAARARHDLARLNRQQAAESLSNLTRLVDFDVRSAYVDVEVAREQIEATRATRELREEALRTESERFRVGASTTFLVAQAQRDLLQSQINEARAMVNYRQALIELYRLDGSLLERRAIAAPGRS